NRWPVTGHPSRDPFSASPSKRESPRGRECGRARPRSTHERRFWVLSSVLRPISESPLDSPTRPFVQRRPDALSGLRCLVRNFGGGLALLNRSTGTFWFP